MRRAAVGRWRIIATKVPAVDRENLRKEEEEEAKVGRKIGSPVVKLLAQH